MFIGTLGAINQTKIKRLLAYSSIAHVGYLLISLATGTIESIEALLIYAVLYTLTIINIFGILLVLSRENFNINNYDQITNVVAINYQPTFNYSNNIIDNYNLVRIDFNYISNPGSSAYLPKILCFSSSKIKLFEKSYLSLIQGNPI
jgi:hypothetical protein